MTNGTMTNGSMTKAELVEEVSRVSDLTKKHSEVIVDTVFRSIIEALHRGENYLKHLGEDFLQGAVASGRFDSTSDFSRMREADVLISAVPTPLGPHSHRNGTLALLTASA